MSMAITITGGHNAPPTAGYRLRWDGAQSDERIWFVRFDFPSGFRRATWARETTAAHVFPTREEAEKAREAWTPDNVRAKVSVVSVQPPAVPR